MGLHVALVDEFDDVLGGGAGKEDFGDTGLFEGSDVGSGDDAADKDGDLVHAFFVEKFHQLRAEGVMSAGEDERPMTSTSSWTAAEAIISGVWRRPV